MATHWTRSGRVETVSQRPNLGTRHDCMNGIRIIIIIEVSLLAITAISFFRLFLSIGSWLQLHRLTLLYERRFEIVCWRKQKCKNTRDSDDGDVCWSFILFLECGEEDVEDAAAVLRYARALKCSLPCVFVYFISGSREPIEYPVSLCYLYFNLFCFSLLCVRFGPED